jgi:hypothetical protein
MKPFYESKTWWTNALVFVIAVLSLPQLGGIVPAEAMPYVGTGAAIANVILRFMTTEPIGLR